MSVLVGTELEGIRALSWRRASLARESCGRAEAGSWWWWRACWREWRMSSSEGEKPVWEEVADGMLCWHSGAAKAVELSVK